MIGSHNSFTYLDSTNALYNACPFAWRCQYKTIQEQYKDGVRFFDVRVSLEKKANKNMWRATHGSVKLNQLFISIKAIFEYFKAFEGASFRLLLEDADGKKEFKEEVAPFIKEPQEVCKFIGIKENWEVLYSKMPKLIDYCYVPWHSGDSFWENIKNLELSTIKKWADKHNPTITRAMIDEPTIHFMDYV